MTEWAHRELCRHDAVEQVAERFRYSNLVQTGRTRATKLTSPDGFHLTIDILDTQFQATGALTTTVDGHVYRQPVS